MMTAFVRRSGAALWLGLGLSLPLPAQASEALPEIFVGADLALGERLIREHRCAECHVRRVGGDGSAIYRPQGRITTPGTLRGMVEQCNTELNLGLFPEEVSAIAAVLHRDHYRAGWRQAARPASR
ncbi:hypothetical protein ABIC99_001799 [Sphaerotilus sulfidivorans]|uniref:Cytochrome c domain-containing protein n=2 Tax=Sphaerotilus sulfidivorans TaxID=639200 RepID=A0ABV2IM37_9BURK|nr:hypothetical protein [Sphaerotilus sulfidivorans]